MRARRTNRGPLGVIFADTLHAVQFGHDFLCALGVSKSAQERRAVWKPHLTAAHLGYENVVDSRLRRSVTEEFVLPSSRAEGQIRRQHCAIVTSVDERAQTGVCPHLRRRSKSCEDPSRPS